MKFSIYFILFMVCQPKLFAQVTKEKKLPDIIIQDKKIKKKFNASQQIDSSTTRFYTQNTMPLLLQLHSNVFVKNYGVGSLSTISLRGSSAAQTSVNWQGMQLNNAMTGLSDISSIPVSFFENINIEYGNNMQRHTIGGSIQLSNETNFDSTSKDIRVGLGYESLRNQSLFLSSSYHSKKMYNQLKAFISSGKNEYAIDYLDKNESNLLQHAEYKNIGLLNDFAYKMNAYNLFSVHVWMQQNTRNIPPTIFEESSAKEEKTNSFRSIIQWNKTENKCKQIFLTGMNKEYYAYVDTNSKIAYNADVISIPMQYTLQYSLYKNQSVSIQFAGSSNLILQQKDANLTKGSVSLFYTIENIAKRISIETQVQKEYSSIFQLPWVMKIAANAKVMRGINLFASVSKNYRAPTLNELYFNPGGNINLQPELSKNLESGIAYKHAHKKSNLDAECTAYQRKVDNWISWFGNAILTPHNIQQVESKGLEINANYHIQLSALSHHNKTNPTRTEVEPKIIHLGLLYAYTLSCTKESKITNDFSIGKQIPYVPRYQFKTNIGFSTKKIDMKYVFAYTGYRFVTTDESQYLMPYKTSNLFFAYRHHIRRSNMEYTFKALNLFNERYESIVGRIMPKRNYSVELLYHFHS